MLIDIFNDAGNSLAASNTCSNDAKLFIEPFHVVCDLDGELAAGTSERVERRELYFFRSEYPLLYCLTGVDARGNYH